MVYVKTAWNELVMTTQNKLDGLNNLETMNTAAEAYITGMLHSDRYYTDAQAEAKFYYTANDGTGSGLICAKLGGYTADQVISTGIPAGIIALWTGAIVDIPVGWYLCNGSNGTPDLRNRFVVGVGSNYEPDATGGTSVCGMTATVTIASHALVDTEVPKHTHGTITDTYVQVNTSVQYYNLGTKKMCNATTEVSRNTGSTGSGDGHTHNASWTPNTGTQSKLPAYFALCYIMKG